eukprot:TRINITY_DN10207_c0_g1_i1.p3 TRINITY_DN10207_c0_g1~~TRINITY_DN10207_c0_g1_i1.p3  ORF type:complete len:68 (+),score=18.12 TRINITY_DN10207_c0_g1_i1:285-488(+)
MLGMSDSEEESSEEGESDSGDDSGASDVSMSMSRRSVYKKYQEVGRKKHRQDKMDRSSETAKATTRG